MSNPVLGVRVSEQDRQLLEKVCQARGEDLSDFIRRAIRTELAKLSYYPQDVKRALGMYAIGRRVKKAKLSYMTGMDVKTAFTKLQEILGIRTFAEESENIVQAMEAEIEELKQALVRVQQDANAYKEGSEVLTERVTELEARLRKHGELLKTIPTIQKQIAYLKGKIPKKKPKMREKLEIVT